MIVDATSLLNGELGGGADDDGFVWIYARGTDTCLPPEDASATIKITAGQWQALLDIMPPKV